MIILFWLAAPLLGWLTRDEWTDPRNGEVPY